MGLHHHAAGEYVFSLGEEGQMKLIQATAVHEDKPEGEPVPPSADDSPSPSQSTPSADDTSPQQVAMAGVGDGRVSSCCSPFRGRCFGGCHIKGCHIKGDDGITEAFFR